MTQVILYPHGLGDVILLTPALRQLPDAHVALLKRFDGTEILPERVHYVLDDPWNDGTRGACQIRGQDWAREKGFEPLWIWHKPERHKIKENFRHLKVRGDVRTEVFISDEHRDEAYWWMRRNYLWDRDYVFIHGTTGMPGLSTAAVHKDFDVGNAVTWARKQWPIHRHVVVGDHFRKDAMPIPAQFEIMRRATRLILADSVFYHAAHALDMDVDFAYFGRGIGTYERVRPLHGGKEHVSWSPPAIQSLSADQAPAS